MMMKASLQHAVSLVLHNFCEALHTLLDVLVSDAISSDW